MHRLWRLTVGESSGGELSCDETGRISGSSGNTIALAHSLKITYRSKSLTRLGGNVVHGTNLSIYPYLSSRAIFEALERLG